MLLLSVDGLHQQDLSWYVRHYPASTLASLVRHGVDYADAATPIPSDSFPGLVGQVTGGDPGVTGIYYDDTFNHDVFPAGTTNCAGPVPGGEAAYTEADDINQLSLDAGQGLSGLPGSILRMTSNPRDVINPANLPVNPETCQPIYPDQYLRVNTIFNVARQAGLRVVYTGGQSKIAEHGGAGFQDRNVPILVDAPGLEHGHRWARRSRRRRSPRRSSGCSA